MPNPAHIAYAIPTGNTRKLSVKKNKLVTYSAKTPIEGHKRENSFVYTRHDVAVTSAIIPNNK